MDPLSLVSGAVGVAAGLGQTLGGLIGMRKKRLEAEKAVNDIQTYTADPELKKVLQMRAARLGIGLSGTARDIANQGIQSAAAGATKSALAMGRGSGLSAIGAIQRQSQRQSQQLALQEEQAQEQSRRGYENAAMAASADRIREFQSNQEKQQLNANIAMEKLAAKRAMLQQGLSGLLSSGINLASNLPGKIPAEKVQPNFSSTGQGITNTIGGIPLLKPVNLPKVGNRKSY